MKKRAVDTIVVTSLLIFLAIILAVILLVWWNSFFPEQISKFDKPIQDSCSEVNLEASISGDDISITNLGNIPINKMGLRLDGLREDDFTLELAPGSSKTITSSSSLSGKKVELIPILLGQGRKSLLEKDYMCPKSNWKEII